jgi:hypothetical protein
LDIRHQVLGVGMKYNVNEHRHERVRRGVRLGVLQQAENDFAAVENTYYLISRRTVRLDLQQFCSDVSR